MSQATPSITAQQPAQPASKPAKAFAAASATSPLAPHTIARRAPQPHDVQIEILYCGVCHSDLHQVRDEWESGDAHRLSLRAGPRNRRPRRQGRQRRQEIQGRRHRRRRLHGRFLPHLRQLQGGRRAVLHHGLHVDLQRPDKILGGVTYGGYSDSIVVDESLRAACSEEPRSRRQPRRCSAPASPPIRRCATGRLAKGTEGRHRRPRRTRPHGREIRARALARTSCSSPRRPTKPPTRMRLGADEVVISKNAAEMQKHAGSFDFILDTVSADHDLNAYLAAAEARRHDGAGRRARKAGADRGVQSDHGPRQPRGHRRSAASARRRRCWISAREQRHRPTSR